VYLKYSYGSPSGWIAVAFGGATVTDFTDLLDAPNSYVGKGGQAVRVKSGANGLEFYHPVVAVPIACSDETTALTAGTAKVTFRMPHAMQLTAVRASLVAAQASGSILTVDINQSGTSILSTKLTIDNTEKTSSTAATAAVISNAELADDAEITIDIDQVGDGTAKGLKVYLIGYIP